MELWHFKYHPDPLATGSVERSPAACRCCQRVTGYIYTGPIYADEELGEQICPWCIADNAAHVKFGATFIDLDAIGDYGEWETVPQGVVEEVAYRTPCFTGWQAERWWTHCGDAAAFLNIVGYRELQEFDDEALKLVRELFGRETGLEGKELQAQFENFDREHGPSSYLFRCLHCGQLGAYWDCH